MLSLRAAKHKELSELSALCLRSKAYWGYDEAFMRACRDELTLHPADMSENLTVAELDTVVAGVAKVSLSENEAELDLLYVDPAFIGRGVGRVLFDWSVQTERKKRAKRLLIDADPNALVIYQNFGAVLIGESPSGSIKGRMLPQLEYLL
ncbi:MAG: GNAT family N-acetyltransferase [Pseudomonadota bacterium]